MKRFTRCVCLLLVLSLTLAVPAMAAENENRASNYFGSRSCYLWDVTSSGFQVWFDVRAVRAMDELGASTIKIQQSSDTVNWTTIATYTKDYYPSMITRIGTVGYSSYIQFSNVVPGFYYRAYVEVYAMDDSGTATRSDYTSYVYIP